MRERDIKLQEEGAAIVKHVREEDAYKATIAELQKKIMMLERTGNGNSTSQTPTRKDFESQPYMPDEHAAPSTLVENKKEPKEPTKIFINAIRAITAKDYDIDKITKMFNKPTSYKKLLRKRLDETQEIRKYMGKRNITHTEIFCQKMLKLDDTELYDEKLYKPADVGVHNILNNNNLKGRYR